MLSFITLFLLVAASAPASADETALYVSPAGNDSWTGKSLGKPFATIARARDEIRALKKSGLRKPVTVHIAGGRYEIAEPLVFTPEDSGTEYFPVVYKADSGENPLISGGRIITGWKKGRNGLWFAELPDVRAGNWTFRQLYVNGDTRLRARLPKTGFYRIAGLPDGSFENTPWINPSARFQYAPGDINPQWTNIGDIEIVALHFWIDEHLTIKTIDPATRIVETEKIAGLLLRDNPEAVGCRYYVDNVFEGISAGEWYLDRAKGILYYVPLPGEDVNRLEFTAPASPKLVEITGDPANGTFVEHISFQGLTFMHANYNPGPDTPVQAQAAVFLPGAIELTGTKGCSFDGCTIRNVGGYGIRIKEGCTENRVTSCEIACTGGGGIMMLGGNIGTPIAFHNSHNTITDNEIHHIGEVWHSAVGIMVGYEEFTEVSHNHIHHTRYSAMSVGWSWGYARTIGYCNRIEYNLIHDIGQEWLSDMGGIYMLGISPGTVVRNNLVYDVHSYKYGGFGIYTDEGSTHVMIENNIAYRISTGSPFFQHYGRENVIRNNIWAYAQDQMMFRMRDEEHISYYFEHNILLWDDDTPWTGTKIWMDWFIPNRWGNAWADSNFVMDYNVYWNPNHPDFMFRDWTFTEWKARGNDVHSLVADPMFEDPKNGDFTLLPGSPALKLGFKPIDMSTVGPRR